MSAHSIARVPLLVLGAVVLAVGWLGCAGSEDPAAGDEQGGPSPTAAASTAKPSPTTRPDFEAGFVETDAGLEDPTPDGGGNTCVDKNDVGGNEALAKALPDTNDSQNSPLTVSSVLNGPVDVDFFKLHVADESFHLLQPNLQIATSGVEMCVFVRCDVTGNSNVTSCSGGVLKKSDIGIMGCCGTGPSQVTPAWDCKSTNDSATLFVRISQTQNKCASYSFSYSF